MHLLSLDQDHRVSSFSSKDIARALLNKERASLAFFLFMASLIGALVATKAQTSIDGAFLLMLAPIVFTAIFVPGRYLVAPWALRWFLRRPETRRYFQHVLEHLCAENPNQIRPQSARVPWSDVLRQAGVQCPSSAIAFHFNAAHNWHKEFKAISNLLFENPADNQQATYHCIHFLVLDMTQVSWLTRRLAVLGSQAPMAYETLVLFPLQGHFDGSAHERLHLLGSIETHHEALNAA